ncbi:hypothetical protein [Pseudomonas sp. ICMP 8385]|uniref:hypothetical protein n=1 Tax=Pseudomonas sp. ICMP 8385 TaxID=1718920 RepID=UPI00159B8B2D|nr:hypothetical protein [Pseudomonas sp. ICMP 8385]
MQTPQDDTVMDFGPNLFGGEGGSAPIPSADDADATNEALEGAASVSHQMTEGCIEEKTAEAGGGQAGGNSAPSSSNVAPGVNTQQAASKRRQPRPAAARLEVTALPRAAMLHLA